MEPGASHALASMGVDATSFAAAPLTEEAVATSDLILVATRDHRRDVVGLVPSAVRRTFTMRELARIAQFVAPSDVPHPSGAEYVERMRQAVAWAAQLRGTVPRPASDDDDDLGDPLGASDATYAERAVVIAASVERIVPYLLGESAAG
jgi:protein-tyrosine phosphatase